MLDQAAIARRIPHEGAMCLLDRVVEWTDTRVRCMATSHRDPAHPLREAGGLPVWAAIEYAAQAAALHGSLLGGEGPPRPGVLGRLQDVRPACEWLHAVGPDLELEATLLHRDPVGGIYAFIARADGRVLIEGRFTLLFTDA